MKNELSRQSQVIQQLQKNKKDPDAIRETIEWTNRYYEACRVEACSVFERGRCLWNVREAWRKIDDKESWISLRASGLFGARDREVDKLIRLFERLAPYHDIIRHISPAVMRYVGKHAIEEETLEGIRDVVRSGRDVSLPIFLGEVLGTALDDSSHDEFPNTQIIFLAPQAPGGTFPPGPNPEPVANKQLAHNGTPPEKTIGGDFEPVFQGELMPEEPEPVNEPERKSSPNGSFAQGENGASRKLKPENVARIATTIDAATNAMQKHLKLIREAYTVATGRHAKHIFEEAWYSQVDEGVGQFCSGLEQWGTSCGAKCYLTRVHGARR